MSFTPPPAQPDLPPDAPSRQDSDAQFMSKANALVAWYAPFVTWLRSFVGWVAKFQNEAIALQSDVASKSLATTGAASAAVAAAEAAALSATAAASAVFNTGAAQAFEPGKTYTKGNVAVSSITLHTYRALTSGVRNIDPSQDGQNWIDLQTSSAKSYYLASF